MAGRHEQQLPDISGTAGNAPMDLDDALARVMGDAAFLLEMLDDFGVSAASCLERIRDAVDRGDHAQMARAAHELKGAALNLSAQPLVRQAAVIGRMGKAHDMRHAAAAVEELARLATQMTLFGERLRRRLRTAQPDGPEGLGA